FSGMLEKQGRVGAITSRSFLVGRDLRAFRKRLLDSILAPLQLFLDLGIGVLDAMVETAAYVLGTGPSDTISFLDLRDTEKTVLSISSDFAVGFWQEISR